MNKPLLLSLAAAVIFGTNLNAQSMYERIQAMELQMKMMEEEIVNLRASKEVAVVEENIESDDSEEDSEEEETTTLAKKDTDDEDDSDEEEDGDEDDEEEFNAQEEIADMQETIFELNKATNGNHLKFHVDYRYAIDNLQYKMADGSKKDNDALMTNRLWINMKWKANDNLSFAGQLAYNKIFGQRSYSNTGYNFETFDWITNENAYDDTIRLRSAYFLYKNDTFMEASIPWTFSIGRRPSTNGHLINMRDDDGAASPMGHTINVEFDGLSSKFSLEDVIGIEGMYVKFCAGRGMSNAQQKFTPVPYASDSTANPNIDLMGLIFVPYNDGQYGLATQYYFANNLIDQDFTAAGVPQQTFSTVGGMHSVTGNFTMNGIGNEISDFLDDTFFFLSGAISVTDPSAGSSMLGSAKSQKGYGLWTGLQMPSIFTEDGRWGLEYNYGSQYWRSITYGEDTNIGSKIAARGHAFETYFTEPLVEDILSLQVRYTYIDYKYSGSNGFFGSTTGTAMAIADIKAGAAGGNPQMIGMSQQVVDSAQDLRIYLRYRY